MTDPKSAWSRLNSQGSISSLESETYLDIAVRDWLPARAPVAPETLVILRKLADAMIRNHQDSWLSDFLAFPISAKADSLLQSSIQANYEGRSDQAAASARISRDLFRRNRNFAGEARSEFELVYALHRGSHARRCVKEMAGLQELLAGHSYHWLEIEGLLELSSCRGMLTDFDSSSQLAEKAIMQARAYHFPVLGLRAVGFAASLNTVEGRLLQSWQDNEGGLALFWQGSFPADRGFQFYSDMELAAERSNEWNLATSLQRQVLVMLKESGRTNLAAMAHFRLIGLLESAGDLHGAEEELQIASRLFQSLPQNQQTDLYKSYSEVLLATILLSQGDVDAASDHLQKIRPDLSQWDNFNLHLRYLKAAAEVARFKHDPREEILLTKLVELGDSGFNRLRSPKDRWDWDREIGPGYRRLLELEARQSDAPEQILADWEYYRAKTYGLAPVSGAPLRNPAAKRILLGKIGHLDRSTLLTFAVLPRSVVAWVADDRGVEQVVLAVDSSQLAQEVTRFHRLCSDPKSSLEKVKTSGSRLYQSLLAPMEKHLDPGRTLYIEADKFLGVIPWTALVMRNGSYFGESHTVINTLSITSPAPGDRPGSMRALVADPGAVNLDGVRYQPLPNAAREAEEVASLYSNSTSLSGKQVTAEALMEALPKASVFQFAGHATDREYGGELVVHGENGAGATLSATSLSKLTLSRTKLVVLSACSTAVTDEQSSTSPHGLVFSFMAAGAQTVVASGWDVDSASTAAMMARFHKLLRAGHSVSQSFRLAQMSVLSHPETEHPCYWAAFSEFQRSPGMTSRN